MKALSSQTAILLFARSSNTEVEYKWLPQGSKIFSKLNERAGKLIAESGLPYFHITEHDQIGQTFGERFSNALGQIFELGYTSIISIGHDTPNLTQKDIQIALEKLHNGNAVLGPSKDGGIYLMGLHARDFDKSRFEQFSWGTSKLRQTLGDYLLFKGRELHLLPVYSDLDSESDIPYLLSFRSFIPSGIFKLLQELVQQKIHWDQRPVPVYLQPLWQPHLNKGSPR